jgi:glycosyltransferase involved in cell wall biosynthesis
MDITVVVPTRNRHASLQRLLNSLASQTRPPKEIIVVDASDTPLENHTTSHDVRWIRSEPSVCRQRNKGIALARGTHIWLADDDLEFPPNYIELLADFLKNHPDVGAVCGILPHPTESKRMSTVSLLYRFLFQLSVWTDLGTAQGTVRSFLVAWFARRGNGFTLAGWPLVTQQRSAAFRTSVYGLGGSLIRRSWLLESPFDEILDSHGIGDNYGVALGFPEAQPITVLPSVTYAHHRDQSERLPDHLAAFHRVLALDYFMSYSNRFTWIHRAFLIWSLIGDMFSTCLLRRWPRLASIVKALWLILARKNPYVRARRLGSVGPVHLIP